MNGDVEGIPNGFAKEEAAMPVQVDKLIQTCHDIRQNDIHPNDNL
jgi:hypothetical protein